MPMIDVYAATGTFTDPRKLAQELASTLMAIEQVPDIPMFRKNTAAFVHDLRTWVLLTEAPDGGWGLAGHANTNAELVTAARAEIARLSGGGPQS
jgi:phenylpyruvate tautomerase PptA (4-oxalocrotonate tautomerase family)